MTRWVKTKCGFCRGRLHLPSHDVLLTVHTRQSWRDTYRFLCPLCREENSPPATRQDVTILVSAGVRLEQVRVPDELEDPTRLAQRPLTWDDVLDFAASAGGTECLAEEAGPWRSLQ